MSFEIKIISDVNELKILENDWADILAKSDCPSIALTLDWIVTWWQALQKNQKEKLYFIVFFEDNKAIAIFPFYWCKAKYRGIPIKKISLMVNGLTPHADFIIARGMRDKAINLLLRYLSSQKHLWDMVVLDKFRDNFNRKCLINSLKLNGLNYGLQPSLRTPVISVDKSWDLFWSQRSYKFRRSIRNKLNRVRREQSITIDKIETPEELLEALPLISRLSSLSWKHKINKAIADSPAESEFFNTFTRVGSERGWVHIWLLKYNDEPIAYEYHLVYGDTIYPLRADFNENYRKLSPGSVLEYSIIKDLCEKNNFYKYYTCADDYPHLMNWTNNLEELCRIDIFNNSILSNFLYTSEYRIIPHLRKSNALRKLKGLLINKGFHRVSNESATSH